MDGTSEAREMRISSRRKASASFQTEGYFTTHTQGEKREKPNKSTVVREFPMAQVRRTYACMFVVSSLACAYLRHYYEQIIPGGHLD